VCVCVCVCLTVCPCLCGCVLCVCDRGYNGREASTGASDKREESDGRDSQQVVFWFHHNMGCACESPRVITRNMRLV
jgi:hypothetical protein